MDRIIHRRDVQPLVCTHTTVKNMDDLKKYLRMNFGFFLQGLDDSKLWCGQFKIDEFVEDLLYNNGVSFVRSRLVR